MPYRRIKLTKAVSKREARLLTHADALLSDVYTMLGKHPLARTKAGGCDFSAVLVLVCLLDALAAWVYHPSRSMKHKRARRGGRGVQFRRIEKLVLNLMPWHASWSPDKATFVEILYDEFRNPMAHEAGRDPKRRVKARPRGWEESVVGKWGKATPQKIGNLDGLKKWPEAWPILEPDKRLVRSGSGKPFRYKLCIVALYWAVKDIVRQLSH